MGNKETYAFPKEGNLFPQQLHIQKTPLNIDIELFIKFRCTYLY